MANSKKACGERESIGEPFCAKRGCRRCLDDAFVLGAKTPAGPAALAAAGAQTRKGPESIGVAAVGVDNNVRSMLSGIFNATGEFHSSGFFKSSADALGMIPAAATDVAVVEMNLSDACGIWCARELMARSPGLKTVLVTTLRDRAFCQRAAAAGIHEFCLKPLRFAQVLATLRFLASSARAGGEPILRNREEALLRCLADGMLYKEIADQLGLKHSKLRKLQHRAFKKLHAENRAEAVKKWRGSPPGCA